MQDVAMLNNALNNDAGWYVACSASEAYCILHFESNMIYLYACTICDEMNTLHTSHYTKYQERIGN